MKKSERYIERKDLKDDTHLKISVYYDKGGMNYFSGTERPRGFYLSVCPVSVTNGMISFTAFSGFSKFLLKATRYSDKQFNLAVEISKEFEDELIANVIAKNKAA